MNDSAHTNKKKNQQNKPVSLVVNVFLLEILHSFVFEDWQTLKS